MQTAVVGASHALHAAELRVREKNDKNQIQHGELLTLVVRDRHLAGARAHERARGEGERGGELVEGVHLHQNVLEEAERRGILRVRRRT